jgi:superfamily II DNA or RNA helicase
MSLASGPIDAPALTEPARNALLGALDIFARQTRERGREYAERGRVGRISADGELLSAIVRGTEEYDVLWEHTDGMWFPSCSCPVAEYCKHAYAVAWLAAGRGGVARAAPALPSPIGSVALRQLRDSPEPWTRQQAVWKLAARRPDHFVELGGAVLQDVLTESDPDLRCWRLARAFTRVAGGWLPEALEPFRERPELAARAAEQMRVVLARDLLVWAARSRRAGTRRLRLVFGLDAGLSEPAVLRLEARLTTPRLSDAPRTSLQLQQLRGELRADPDLLPPDEAAVLTWLTDHGAGVIDPHFPRGGRALPSRWFLERVADSPVAAWDDVLPDDLARRAGVVPGSPIRLSPDAAQLVPVCASREGGAWVELHFVWPDGRSRPVDEVLHLRGAEYSATQSGLVLADGAFSSIASEPPGHIVERFRSAGGLPLPPAERARMLGVLASAFPRLRETLAAHTHFHRVSPAVALDLRDDDWLQIRLFARAGTGDWVPGRPVPADTRLFEYGPDGGWGAPVTSAGATAWEALGPPCPEAPAVGCDRAPDPGDVWLEAPAPENVEPLVAWLGSLQAGPGTKRGNGGEGPAWEDRAAGWWTRVSRRRVEMLADAWEHRPAGVVFFGTERVRRLLGSAGRVLPRLRIESSGIDWFSVSAEWEAEGTALDEDDLAALRKVTSRFVRLPSGWVDRGVASAHEEASHLLADLGIEPGEGPQRLTLWQLAGARPASLAALEQLGLDPESVRAIAELRERVSRFAGLPRVVPPAGLTATLRSYQQQGFEFLVWIASLGLGAVLADDMGLGKTVQALAWLEHLRCAEPEGGPSLVVAPTSVVHNWAREAARFVPGLRVLLLERGRARHALRGEIGCHDVVVTSYALLRRDIEEWRRIRLRAAILDEAQNVKNPDAAVSRAVLALDARHRLALTGTPLENRPLDLWSIMNFVNPGYLGTRARFATRFDRVDAPQHARTLLAARLRPLLLRRLKREVARDLPERIEERRDCELTPGQRRLYLAEVKRSRALVERLSEAPGGVRHHRIDILAALTRLRQLCCHPALVGGKPALGSGKFEALFELLEPLLAEGHKVLVFSQFVRCLELLAAELRGRDVPYHMLTGATVKRQAVVAAFTDDARPCVFLVSLRAGGSGLNLTAASYVVLLDPWWNPAVEAQAIDRTHRIGQDRTVIAYRLLARGTIEEKIWDLQQRKAALARDLLGEGGFGRALTRDDLEYLLTEQEPS